MVYNLQAPADCANKFLMSTFSNSSKRDMSLIKRSQAGALTAGSETKKEFLASVINGEMDGMGRHYGLKTNYLACTSCGLMTLKHSSKDKLEVLEGSTGFASWLPGRKNTRTACGGPEGVLYSVSESCCVSGEERFQTPHRQRKK